MCTLFHGKKVTVRSHLREGSNITKNTEKLSLKARSFIAWERNSSLSPLEMSKILGVDYGQHGSYLRKLRVQFKCVLRNRHSLKSLKWHKARGWIYTDLLRGLQEQRDLSVSKGWKPAVNSKNGMIYLVQEELGRLEWFKTGRVNLWITKPATKSRLMQLLACGFMWTGLIQDVKVFEKWAANARLKGAHLTVETGEVLPYTQVDLLKVSNGVVVKMGDISHRTSLEIEFCYPDWAERNERLQSQVSTMMQMVSENLTKALDLNAKQQESFRLWMEDLSAPKRGDLQTDKRLYE